MANASLQSSYIAGSGSDAGKYGVKAFADVTIRNNTLDNATRDVGVNGQAVVIVDNVIHCAPAIVSLGAFSYYAPVGTEAHANIPRYAPGFGGC